MENLTPCYYTSASQVAVIRTNNSAFITNQCVNWSANGYRLPTEAEWEKAARGGLSGHRFPLGDTISWSQANFIAFPAKYAYDVNPFFSNGYNPAFTNGVTPYTSPVDAFPPNGYGLYDMDGNALQMCWDLLDSSWYSNPAATQNDPHGPDISSSNRGLVRGGTWEHNTYNTRCSYRWVLDVVFVNETGFRCVRAF
jgi:sulfatase modifying factor 1